MRALDCGAQGIVVPHVRTAAEAAQAVAASRYDVQAYLLGDDRGVSFRGIKAHLLTFR